MNRWTRRLAATLALLAIAFAQMAISAYACPVGMESMALAPAIAGHDEPCPDLATANLCDTHCDYGSTAVTMHADSPPAPELALLPWGARVAEPGSFAARASTRWFAHGTASPLPARPTPLRI